MLKAYPKIFQLGTKYILDIFNEPVEITEKIDGSQFCFGKINNKLYARSKGAELHFDYPEKMFTKGLEYVESIESKIPNNTIFYAEYLNKPRHNTLSYQRIPKNHLMLFGAMQLNFVFLPNLLSKYANMFEIETVPVIFEGIITPDKIEELLNRKSKLGGVDIEGVVVKNYFRSFILGDQPIPIMAGKYVSEKFKEVHQKNWSKENTSKGKLETYFSGFRTEARWHKAVQHLKEFGLLDFEPRDIGLLIKEIHTDIATEEKENIKDFLWSNFKGEIMRKASAGFPEWYKKQLLGGEL